MKKSVHILFFFTESIKISVQNAINDNMQIVKSKSRLPDFNMEEKSTAVERKLSAMWRHCQKLPSFSNLTKKVPNLTSAVRKTFLKRCHQLITALEKFITVKKAHFLSMENCLQHNARPNHFFLKVLISQSTHESQTGF